MRPFIPLHEGVAGVEEIDMVMKLGIHPMGPLRLADFIGLDVWSVHSQCLTRWFRQPGNMRHAHCW